MAHVLGCLLLSTGCNEDVQDLYFSYPAYFIYNYTQTVPQLNAALNNPGEFATITEETGGRRYLFTNTTGTTPVNTTALNNYSSFRMGICGFIVGLPNIPEPGADIAKVICFDLVCPNCYRDMTNKPLTLRETGKMECTRCERTYDMNSGGIVCKGPSGISLYRYPITYNGTAVIIRSR